MIETPIAGKSGETRGAREPARVLRLVLVLVILFQPGGLNGMWLKMKSWFQEFPFKRQTSLRRQKSYAKSERLR